MREGIERGERETDPSLLTPPSGEAEPAKSILQRILDRDNSSMESHLLMARIHLHLGKPKQCLASLELALSSNFEVGTLHPGMQAWDNISF